MAAIVLLCFCSCGKKQENISAGRTSGQPASNSAPQERTGQPDPNAGSAQIPDHSAGAAKIQADLEDLNKLVRAYVQSKKVIPKSVDELVTSGFVKSLPAPPPGKAYVVQLRPLGYQVILVESQ